MKHITIVFINYIINISIVKQTTLINNNTNKLNFRLIKTFIYLFQFKLNIKYRFDKKHVISNVLSRFSFDNELTTLRRINFVDSMNFDTYFIDAINFFCLK